MAKIVNGSLVLDPDDRIEFVDAQNITHTIYWDDILNRFISDGNFGAEQFVGATNSVSVPRNPQPSDDSFLVPTIWVNSTTNSAFLLVNVAPGSAVWGQLNIGGSGGSGSTLDHRITINDGLLPLNNDPFDMWITIDPV
jgi:hypothetical protein